MLTADSSPPTAPTSPLKPTTHFVFCVTFIVYRPTCNIYYIQSVVRANKHECKTLIICTMRMDFGDESWRLSFITCKERTITEVPPLQTPGSKRASLKKFYLREILVCFVTVCFLANTARVLWICKFISITSDWQRFSPGRATGAVLFSAEGRQILNFRLFAIGNRWFYKNAICF